MTRAAVVTLLGGPFDGLQRLILADVDLFTLEYDDGPSDKYQPPARKVGLASYRRQDDRTFVHCLTQVQLGDIYPQLWEESDYE